MHEHQSDRLLILSLDNFTDSSKFMEPLVPAHLYVTNWYLSKKAPLVAHYAGGPSSIAFFYPFLGIE